MNPISRGIVRSRSVRLNRVYHGVWAVFRTFFLIGMAYILIFPVLFMMSRAFRPGEDILNPSIIWLPSRLTLDNFTAAMKILDYSNTALFTARIVLISTLLAMITCSLAGYALARYNIRGKKLLIGLATLTVIVPMQTYIIPLFFQFRFFDYFGLGSLLELVTGITGKTNLTQTEIPYYIANAFGAGIRSGLFILLFMQFFKGMPKELEDAARIDGCGEGRTFLRVILPNALPVYLVVFLFSMIWYWNDYFFAQIMMRQNQLLANKIGMLRTLVNMSMNTGAYGDGLSETVYIHAGALLFIAPPLLIYLVAQRYFVQSIERTGIVG